MVRKKTEKKVAEKTTRKRTKAPKSFKSKELVEEPKKEKKQPEIFDLTRAGQAFPKRRDYKMFYTRVLEGKKALQGKIKRMTPEAFIGGEKRTFNFRPYLLTAEAGEKLAMPVLDKVHGKKIGFEAALAAKELGIKEMPVLVCDSIKAR